jgi:hypothetical protein
LLVTFACVPPSALSLCLPLVNSHFGPFFFCIGSASLYTGMLVRSGHMYVCECARMRHYRAGKETVSRRFRFLLSLCMN